MIIFNIMLSKILGGIEQAFLDYDLMLRNDHNIINIIRSNAKIACKISNFSQISTFYSYDIISQIQILRLINRYNPSVIICHGNRPIKAMFPLKFMNIPIIGVAHNYKTHHMNKCDYIFAVSETLANHIKSKTNKKVFYIPNCINLDREYKIKPRKSVVTIGTMGRFVKQKGFKNFIQIISKLRDKKIFKAIIAGDGIERDELIKMRDDLNLSDTLEIRPWVENKEEFFNTIDIFILPSVDEPFGIVLLEAAKFGVPIITTNTEGPKEIFLHKKECLISDSQDQMRLDIETLIDNQELCSFLSRNAYEKLATKYSLDSNIKNINSAISYIYDDFRK